MIIAEIATARPAGCPEASADFGENLLSKDLKAPKTAPSKPAKKPQPRKDELSTEDLDKATGGLLPAVSPEK